MSNVGRIDVPLGSDGKIDTVKLLWFAIVSKLNSEKCKSFCEKTYFEDDDAGWFIDFIEEVSADPECNWELCVDSDVAVAYGDDLDLCCIAWLKTLIGVNA